MIPSFLPAIRARLTLLFAFLALAVLLPVVAQQPDPPKADPAGSTTTDAQAAVRDQESDALANPEQAPEKTIPIEEIAVRSQAAVQDVLKLGSDDERAPLLESVRQDLPELQKTLEQVSLEIESIVQSGRVGRRLRQIDDQLGTARKQVDDWQTDLVDLTRDLQDSLAQLARIEKLWTSTREAIAGEEGAALLLEQIDAVLAQTAESKATVLGVRDEALSIQAEVSNGSNRLTALLKEKNKLSEITRKDIFKPDSPFIWSIANIKADESGFSEELSTMSASDLGTLRAYFLSHPVNLVIQLLVMVLTAVFLIRVGRKHQATLESDPRTKSAAKLLKHPLANGIVIALVLTPVFLVSPPFVVYRYIVYLVLVPVLILLKSTLEESFKRSAQTTILLYVLIRFSEHMPEFSFAQRFTALIVAVLGTISVVRQWRIFPEPGTTRESGSFPFARWAGRIGIFVYPIAGITNILGLFALSSQLLSGFVGVVTLALILIAGSNAIREFLRIAMVVGPLRHTAAVRLHYATVDQTISRILRLTTLFVWVLVTLLIFGIYTPVRDAVSAILGFGWQVGALSLSVGSILAFFFTIWLSILISRSIRFVADAEILPRLDLPRGIPSTISMIIHYGIISIGIIIAMAAAGIHLSQMSIIIGALGVGIGFGLQNLVNNFVSGLILIFERPIKIGDKIQFGTTFGEVRSIGIRASTVRSFDGAEIIVPNGNLISNEVTNWTLSDQQRRIDISVGVAYGNDPEKVIALLTDVVGQFDAVLKDPAPFISFDAFGESSLDFTVRFWIDDFSIGLRLKSAILTAINKALGEAGIEIPFPQRDLHIRSVDAPAARALDGRSRPD
ncbi:MAG: mechanosensitive ion channel [Opitutaceae bacterium]